jgi:hypothetical protein
VDDSIQDALQRDGFVKVHMLSEVSVHELFTVYNAEKNSHHGKAVGFHSTTDTGDIRLIRTVDRRIREIVSPAFDEVFQSVDLVMNAFLVKESHSPPTPAHRDLTYTDESKFQSYHVWTALQDTGLTEGCLWFVPGSHHLPRFIRSSPTCPWTTDNPVGHLVDQKVHVPLLKGESVVFYHATIHGSEANASDHMRIGVASCLIEREAPLYHYYFKDGRLVRYHLARHHMVSLRPGLPPDVFISSQEVSLESGPPKVRMDNPSSKGLLDSVRTVVSRLSEWSRLAS